MGERLDANTDLEQRLSRRLGRIYGEERAGAVAGKLLARVVSSPGQPARERWSERDVVVVTYGDSLTRHAERPLVTLREFLKRRLSDLVSAVHVLPFYPYSSDDGFSVIDYRAVNPMLGDWEDIEELAQDFDLMVDLVLNHVSTRSLWFKQFLGDRAPGKDYFHVVDPRADLSGVVRPRVKPLLVEFETEEAVRHVWATFSEDQIDLNFENPDVLLEMADVLLGYLERGARLVRLDAVAFLWKRIGTRCIHLPETHEVVKVLRDVAEAVAPGCVILTETNVPHEENISYFGDGDEAHLVYQFSLPPLLLHALYTESARYLTQWAQRLSAPPPGCTYLNFTASHDGVGLRPVEGILPEQEVDALVTGMQRAGGYASARDLGDGRRAVYELNITYFDALRGSAHRREDGLQIPRFLCSQLIALSLRGIPALYVQSIVATENDHERVDQTGHLRSINRTKWAVDHADALLDDPRTPQHRVFSAVSRALRVRRTLAAFHPDARQRTLDLGEQVFCCERIPGDGMQVLVIANVTGEVVSVELPEAYRQCPLEDALSGLAVGGSQSRYELGRYQVVWLVWREGHSARSNAAEP